MGYSTISFPRIFNISTGKTQLESDSTSINQCLGLLLRSSRGELFGDPMFGSNLMRYIYEPNNIILRELVANDILTAISLYEKRISVSDSDILVSSDGSSVYISINYYINESDEYGEFNLVISTNSMINNDAVVN